MLIAQTSAGIARVADAAFELLDTPGRALDDFIVAGSLDELARLSAVRTVNPGEVTLEAPLRRPGKIIIIGLNYRDHAAEVGSPLPSAPRFHLIPGSAVTASGATIRLPKRAPHKVDYECELGIVVGRSGRDIPEKHGWDYVAGGTAANDVSARDVQLGENPDLPMANPALATPSGNLIPTCSTCERRGKLPSSLSTQTVSSPRRAEKNALSPVSRANRVITMRA